MGNIVLLDDLTINKIAAGEVIERPASVVKELVENSIDAGATNINVEIKNGGISYIRVTDNGKGLLQDDMEIAFERHATSKIRQADDLETVRSMGFRGEALASIAAIAKIEMKSKTPDSDIGYEVVVEGGNILESHEAGCPQGTTITIENLFYNTPVRYKFLKKDFTESGYIEDVITRIALINPNIAIKLINSGKTIVQTTGNGNLKDVVYSIYGKEIAENILEVDYQYEDIKVTGVIGKPSLARSNRANQLFFVNKRYIKDKTLTSSTEQAFKGMITIGKFGFAILNLDMDPQKVDVNVHPAKLEVRFEEEGKVFKAVFHAIKETLLKSDLVSNPEREYNNEEPNNTWSINKNTNNVEIKNNETVNPAESNEQEDNKGGSFRSSQPQYEKENIIAQLYEQRNRQNDEAKKINTNYDSLLNKMHQMQKEVDDFRNTSTVAEASTPYNKENLNEENTPTDNANNMEKTQIINTEELNAKLDNTDLGETRKLEGISELGNTQTMNLNNVIEKAKELENVTMEHGEGFDEMYTSVFGRMPVQEQQIEEPKESAIDDAQVITSNEISLFEDDENKKYIPQYKFIGIAFSTYIIIELNNEVYIIDQHAAHERIMYEKVKENYYNDDTKDSQLMLLPDIITLTHKEMDVARENMDMFRKAGFTLEEFGDNTIKLTGVPNIILDLDTKELFLETLDEINTVARTAKQEIEEKFIATVACKAAVKAHMALSKEEVDSLMEDLLKLPNPFTCPHGRPTAIRMSKNDIERKFERRK